MTPAGLSRLKELGITTLFDLRSVPELQRKGPEWEGVEVHANGGPFYTRPTEQDAEPQPSPSSSSTQAPTRGDAPERIWTPVFKETDYSPAAIAERYRNYATTDSTAGFVAAYRTILQHAGPAYRTIIAHLCAPDPSPVLVHCTAGKDRTGVLVALLFLLCGVTAETVAEEYALTDLGLGHRKEEFRERLLRHDALRGNEVGVERMIASRAENMRDTIVMIRDEFGGAEGYVRNSLGFTGEEVEMLRRNLIVRERAVL